MTTNWRALCVELYAIFEKYDDESNLAGIYWDMEKENNNVLDRARAALAEADGPAVPEVVGPEWQPCVKRPITVHVREQRLGEQHVSTREGITPVRPDDLIMRGVAGEEYPIGRELFQRTYRMGGSDEPAVPEGREPASVVGEPSDDELHALADQFWVEETAPFEEEHYAFARAVLARWGHQPAPLPAGEVEP